MTKPPSRSLYRLALCAFCCLVLLSAQAQHPVQVDIRDGKVLMPIAAVAGDPGTPTYRPFPYARFSAIINLTISTTPARCAGSNGTVTITASGGIAPYTYSLVGYWTQQTGYFPSVSPGTYSIEVTDANGDIGTGTVTVGNTTPRPVLTITSSQNASSCSSPTASVTLGVTGGTAPFEYSMDGINFQSSNVFSGLYPGVYSFLVRDANGCGGFTTNFISGTMFPPNCPSSFGVTYTQFVCNGTGGIRLTFFGPNGPYTYSIDGVNFSPVNEFDNFPPGTHYIYYQSANGTIGIIGVNIYRSCSIITNWATTESLCNQSTGSVTLTPSNGTAPYMYSMDGVNFQSSNVFTGLHAGYYFVTVRDANGITASVNVRIEEDCPEVSLSMTGESCTLGDGIITATASGGTAPYTYSIDGSNFQTSNVFTGLAAGPYTITVRDNLGNTGSATINVLFNCLNVTATATHPTCANSNGSITATGGGGVAPYQYSVNGVNFQASNIFNNLPAGNYTVTVRDNSNRIGTFNIVLTDIAGPSISANTQATACSNNNGSITISGTGGTAPYTYSINAVNYQANNLFVSLPSGNYTAYIKDANGCIASTPVVVVLHCPAVSAVSTHETCNSNNGTISTTGSAGTAPYTYSINGIDFQASILFTGLAAGTYTITIKDADGVTNTTTAIIQHICPTVTATGINGLCGTSNASIIATGADGLVPYEYSINGVDFQTLNRFDLLPSGNYTVTVRDAMGLRNTTSVTVNNFPPPQVLPTSLAATCLNNDGSISIGTAGGTTPFTFSINGTSFQSSSSFAGLASGNYSAYVKDANNCLATQAIVVAPVNNLTLLAGSTHTICEGDDLVLPASSNGATFTWTPAITLSNNSVLNPTAAPVANTKYYIAATLGACSRLDSVMVIVNPAPIAHAGLDSTICYGQPIRLQGTGGTNYTWSPSTYLDDPHSANPLLVNPTASIVYRLFVTDNLGCPSLLGDDVRITVTSMPKLSAGNDTAIVMNQPFQLQAIDVNNSGFINYTWTPSSGLSNPNIPNPVAAISGPVVYTLKASTVAGCQAEASISLKTYKGPDIYVPTAFTPNGDGLNDILRAISVGIKEFRYFSIYNRWGERVFYTTDPRMGWNGKFGGLEQDNAVFAWIALGIDDQGNTISRKGTVVLIR